VDARISSSASSNGKAANANAALQALIADYLQEARRLNAVPMTVSALSTAIDASGGSGSR
jgi:hypothetical protein